MFNPDQTLVTLLQATVAAGASDLHLSVGRPPTARRDGTLVPFEGVSILTPQESVFEGEVEYVQVPGTEGYLGVLAHHASLVTGLAAGTLTVRKSGGAEEQWKVASEAWCASTPR